MSARTARTAGSHYAPEGDAAPLTKAQRQSLALLARRAWERAGRPGDSFDAWRHQQSIRACGCRITQAAQRNYLDLKAAFQDAAGESGQALDTLLRAQSNPRRVAHWKLRQLLHHVGLPLAYADTIARRQYRRSLPDLEAHELWRIYFTVKNRAAARTRRAAA